MSSSKIIKSEQVAADSLTEFNFMPIGRRLVVAAPPDGSVGFIPYDPPDTSTGFVPMELFGTSQPNVEIDDQLLLEQDAPEEPAGIVLTEAELDQRLRESYESGLLDGKNLAERGLLNVFKSLRTAVEGLHSLREKVMRESEDELVRLITMVARKVIQREVSQDRNILSDVVQKAIADISERDEIIVHLNPDDYSMVTSSSEEYFRKELVMDRMQFKADPAVNLGSCRVETEMGTIDASFDSQLDEIFRRLQEERSLSTGIGA